MMRAIADANTRAPPRVTITSSAATGATHAVCDAGYAWERTTNVRDAEWLCRLLDAGLPRASFVRSEPTRELRNLTRYCKPQIQGRAGEVNRLQKPREDAGIKLDCVRQRHRRQVRP